MHLDKNRYKFSDGQDVLNMIEKFDCPLYVYDTNIIRRQYDRLMSAFEGVNLSVNYACKASSNISLLRFIGSLGAGLDTVSIQELELGLLAGFTADTILFTPNGVSLDEIEMAQSKGVRINIDNLSMLEQFGHKYPGASIGVRINPHIMAGGNSKISTGHIDSKFGISYHQLPLLQRILKTTGLKLDGLHMHTGSDILDTEVFLQGAEILFETAGHFEDLNYIDFGSGFKVPYKANDISTDIEDLGRKLKKRFKQFTKGYGKEVQLKFEPGKYLVSEAGYFFAKVNVIKQTTSTVFAGLDTGMNHLIRPMFYDSYHEIINVSKPNGKSRIYTVVGYICETDTFGVNRRIAEIHEGDILCFKNAGAYCFAMSSNYNSRLRPAEVMLYNGEGHLVRRAETLEDLLRTQRDFQLDF